MKKILYVIPTTSSGGIEKLVYDWIKLNQTSNIFKCELLTFNKTNGNIFESLHIKIHEIKLTNSNRFKKYDDINKIKSFFRFNNYDIVHSNVSFYNGIISKYAKLSNVKLVISHSHVDKTSKFSNLFSFFYHYFFYRYLKKLIIKYSDYLLSCSKSSGKYLYGNKSYIVINNSIEVKNFKFSLEDRNEIRNKFKIRDKKLILHVGRFNKVKNHIFLLNLFKLFSKNDDFILILIGEGELFERIKRKSIEYNLQNRIIFLGYISDIYKFYSAADLFILPSFIEGFPISIIEAQANGLFVIASNNVTREVKITNLVHFISLYIPIIFWKNTIIKSLKISPTFDNRQSYNLKVSDKDYDNSKSFDKLLNIYSKFNE